MPWNLQPGSFLAHSKETEAARDDDPSCRKCGIALDDRQDCGYCPKCWRGLSPAKKANEREAERIAGEYAGADDEIPF